MKFVGLGGAYRDIYGRSRYVKQQLAVNTRLGSKGSE